MPDELNRSSAQLAGIAGRRRRVALMLGAVAGAAVLMLSAAVWSHPGASSASSQSNGARPAVARIPLAAQGPISAALGREQAGYRILGRRADNSTQRFGAVFSNSGATIVSGSAHVRFRLVGYGRASAMRRASRVSPRVSANRVDYARPGVDEWYLNGPLGLEQGFDVSARPAPAGGPLTVALALSGNLRPRLVQLGLQLENAAGSLRYGSLTASDAHSHHLRSWLELRSGRLLIRVDDRHAAYPIRIDPLVAQAKLTASDGALGDFFGKVAVSPDTIAVGATNHAVNSDRTNVGAVYLFTKPASGWAHVTQTAELTASEGASGLGETVAISGDTIVAGASTTTVGTNTNQGAVYVFVKPASGWRNTTQTAELTASDGRRGDGLGDAVAISGNTIVAGPFDHEVGQNADQGEAYVFTKPDTGWTNSTESQRLIRADGAAGDAFGQSVAISGDTIVVGARNRKVGDAIEQGSAYVYTNTAVGAEATGALSVVDGAAGDHFGFSVAASGDTVVVGAPDHQVGLNHQGAAYVFVKPLIGWQPNTPQSAELTASDGATSDQFGNAVAASGDSVLVGAPLHDVGSNRGQGAAYLFTKPGDAWTSTRQTEELTASDGTAGSVFGVSVGLSGNLATVGDFATIGDNIAQGAAYLFGVPPTAAIASPTNGATDTQNSIIPASFSCTAPAGTTITACTAPTQDGAPIDTSTLGQHTFTVTADDRDGLAATQTATYTVIPSQTSTTPSTGPTGTKRRLSITAVRQSASVWRVGGSHPRIARGRPPVGTTFSFVLSETARATLSFTRQAPGRRVRGKCAVPSVRNKRQLGCTRTIAAGAVTLSGHGGLNRVRFDGRLAHGKTLRPGRYRMTITATTPPGQRTHSRPLQFTVAK